MAENKYMQSYIKAQLKVYIGLIQSDSSIICEKEV